MNGEVPYLKLSVDIFGNPYLPGQEPVVVKEMFEEAKAYEDAKTERMRLTKKESEGKQKLTGLARKYRDLFEESSDGMQFQYACGGIIVEVDRSESVVTKKESSSKPEKKKGKKDAEAEAVY